MSFLKKLFGGGDKSGDAAPAAAKAQVEHKGYVIKAMPYKEGGQWQTCGAIVEERRRRAEGAPLHPRRPVLG